MMTAKEYLKLYRDAVRAVDILQEEYDKQMEQIDSIRSALGGDGLPRSGDVSKRVENQAIKLAEKAEKLLEAQSEALAIRQERIELTFYKHFCLSSRQTSQQFLDGNRLLRLVGITENSEPKFS